MCDILLLALNLVYSTRSLQTMSARDVCDLLFIKYLRSENKALLSLNSALNVSARILFIDAEAIKFVIFTFVYE